MFGWFNSEQREMRQKIKLDRKHLEARARRFLKSYLDADVMRKAQFYRAVEDASKHCQPAADELPHSSAFDDPEIAEATSKIAMNVVLAREKLAAEIKANRADLVTDAYATVGIAYHRAASLYAMDMEMQKLGTAAVHMLTMASSYVRTEENDEWDQIKRES